jgi:hypothetical protein
MFKDVAKDCLSPTSFAVWAVGTVFLGVVGPFGMNETTPLAGRLVYWFAIIFISTWIGFGCKHAVFRFCDGWHWASKRFAAAVLFTLLFVPFLYGFNAAFFPERWDSLMPWTYLAALLLAVYLSVGLVIEAAMYQFRSAIPPDVARDLALDPPTPEPVIEPAPAPFLARLSPDLGQDIVRLAMQDHYIEVVTDKGSELILMRLSDAIGELEGIDGLQVHRSHWVAHSGITGSEKDRERHYLLTQDGGRVPVSRSFRKAAKEAGLI